uniref:Splicing factor 3B subunit 1 n=1 Tax=Romanomermis culicivorax TaxID=13658 RepID=A0A915HGW5_ROMCU
MSMKAGGAAGVNPTPNDDVIAARRELMKKIKHEVMGP